MTDTGRIDHPKSRDSRSIAVVLACVLAATACSHDDPAPVELPGAGEIAFVPRDPHDVGISLLDPETGEVRRLTTEVRDLTGLSWSPDGSRLAFVTGGHEGIGIVDADGSGLRTITEGADFPAKTTFSPVTWAPDGNQIAFAAGWVPASSNCSGLDCLRRVRARIYVMDLESSALTRLTDDDLLASSPAWSPDGSTIAFVAIPAAALDLDEPVESPQIYVSDAGGGSARAISSFALNPTELAWSPDGASIAFVSVSSDILVIGSNGGEPREIVSSVVAQDGSFENSDPAWSPDGRRILFTRFGVDGSTVWVAQADGSAPQELHAGCCAAWRPVPAT
jgi:TolB protein